MEDRAFLIELRGWMLALAAVEEHPDKRRALLGMAAAIQRHALLDSSAAPTPIPNRDAVAA